jgi:type II secretory pathway component PulF
MFSLADSPELTPLATAALVMAALLACAVALIPIAAVVYAIYFLLTLPMRRTERARLFLDLLEMGMKEGRSPEAAIVAVAGSWDRSLGVRFHRLAAQLETGMQLSQALDKAPSLLPPQVIAMLKSGERIGDLTKVLPACRRLLRDSVSQVRSALNYVIVLACVITPVTVAYPLMLRLLVLPKFKEVFEGMMIRGSELPALTRFVFDASPLMILVVAGLVCVLWLMAAAYLGGPRLRGWLRRISPGLTDRVLWSLPWRRKRLQRDFSGMLAVLLDAGVPEPEAVMLAGEAAANGTMARRADRVRALLNNGARLPEAIREIDDSPEFRWRISNALSRPGGFLGALAGWHEALDAKAFQLEQTAAQMTTTLFVLLNGLIVAVMVIGLFMPLIEIVNRGVLW